jgi:primosomal protein N' (replication factor Y)
VFRLVDEQPVLDGALLKLGRWIADYYCAPLGEVLRSMVPLAGETRSATVYSLTPAGRDAARQLFLTGEETPATALLRLLEARPRNRDQILRKVPGGAKAIAALEKKGFVRVEELETGRDPLKAGSAHLRVSYLARAAGRLPRAQREVLAYLELHPGAHRLADLELLIPGASPAARALARKGAAKLEIDAPPAPDFTAAPPQALNEHQAAAFQAIREALAARRYETFLLQGVTGSGKTEVYLHAIEAALAAGRGSLLLVPEIALTPAVAAQFAARYHGRAAILHSAFHDSERAAAWRRIRNGEALVVVGTRSAVFAPVANLGLIVVDEEHDSSYKQQETPRYHGRDVAIVRAREAGACVVLGSATPSLESRYNAERGKYRLLELPERVAARPLPRVQLIDMRQEFLETGAQATFSRALVAALEERLAAGEQAMLLLNRRGFASFVICRACGERIECPNCAVTLTYHRRDRRLLCHYCNFARAVPRICEHCQSEHLYFAGAGSERVEDELHGLFPAARIGRLDRDTVGGKRDFEEILARFRAGKLDLLAGTQMIAKGHDIPNVTLVGVVNADIGLGLPDFRSAERTFQLLTQAAGRAGRGDAPGTVLIQTNEPDHYAIRLAAAQDFEAFYEKELNYRRLMRYPPFAALANLLIRSADRQGALDFAASVGALLTPAPEGMRILGPAEAPVAKLRNEYRQQVLIKSTSRPQLHELLARVRAHAREKKWPATALVIDVDPVTLL